MEELEEPKTVDTVHGLLENKKCKHNGIISFWKFMFSIMIVIFHVSQKVVINEERESFIFQYGAIGVEFFFIISGYFMTQRAIKNKTNIDESLGKETMQYIKKKIKAFFPYILVAFIISLFVSNWNNDYSKGQIINSLWNLFLLDMTGVKTTYFLGQTWYISAMLISMLVLYPLIRKYKRNFIYLVSPLIVMLIGGWLAHTGGIVPGARVWTGLIYRGLLRAFFELALGGILYIIVERMKNINFTRLGRIFLTLIEMLGFISIFVVTSMKNVSSKYDSIMILILAMSITIAFSEKSIFLKFANNKLFYYLEKLSLPIYLNHVWIIEIVKNTLRDLSYMKKIGIIVILTLIFSIFIMKLTEITVNKTAKNKNLMRKIFTKEI